MAIKIGDIFNGKYQILRQIGEGGMSKVFLGMDININKSWAVKEIDKRSFKYKINISNKKTLDEINLMKELDHVSLPRIVDVIDTADFLYIVMDYIEGETLDTVLNEYGLPKQEDVVDWGLQVCETLKYLHNQKPPIIYRDLKPSNLMLTPEGNIKTIDFGIARKYKEGKNEDTNVISLGTQGYAAPELINGNSQSDERSDIYSFGVTFYRLLTGKRLTEPPYKILPLKEINEELSSGLDYLIRKCTQENPEDRFQSVDELEYVLFNYQKYEYEYIEHQKKRIRKYKTAFFISFLLVMMGVILLIGNAIYEGKQYEKLITYNSISIERSEDNIKEAISMKPKRVDGYNALIDLYKKSGFTEEKAVQLCEIWNQNKDRIKGKKGYGKLAFEIGENFLANYTGKSDFSNRNKLITTKTFFEEAMEYEDELSQDEKVLANTYIFLSSFYEEYIISNSALTAKEGNKEEYEKIINQSMELINSLDRYEGNNGKNLKLVTFQIIQALIDEEKIMMYEKGILKDDILEIENMIYQRASNIYPQNISSEDIKDEILAKHQGITEQINSLYERGDST